MVWNQENSSQGQEADVVPCNSQSFPISSTVYNNSSPSVQSESSMLLHSDVLPVSEFPETSAILPTSMEQPMSAPEYTTNENETSQTSKYVLNGLPYNEKDSWVAESDGVQVLDNANNNNITVTDSEANYYVVDKQFPRRKSRVRQDSTDSYDTVDSSSSGEIFTSAYTDTVSSVESTTFLLKPSSDSEEEMSVAMLPVQENYYNEACMSCSSTEMLNSNAQSGDEIVKSEDGPEDQDPTETDALLEIQVEEQAEGNQGDKEENPETKTEETKQIDDFVPHALVPIQEHEVVRFNVEEVQPLECIKITNNIISVDESFLFHSSHSLWDLESGDKGEKRAFTMNNLHERSSFQDLTDVSKIGKACQKALLYLKDDINFGSFASLNTITNKQIEEDPVQSLSLISGEKGISVVKSNKHLRNLLALSFCLTLLYIAIGSVRNLQSSINHEGGVGVFSMATTSLGYTLGSLFSASIVLNFQPRKCIIVNLIPNLLYVASNIYPTLWLMMPISLIQGLSMAVIWNAISTYVTFLSRGKTQKTGESTEQVSSRYFGILCLLYQSHLIIGNLIASLVLMPGGAGTSGNETVPLIASNASSDNLNTSNLTYGQLDLAAVNSYSSFGTDSTSGLTNVSVDATSLRLSLCGAKFCHHFDMGGSGFAVSDETKYLLFGIYMGCIIISLLIAVFLLEPLDQRLFTSSVKPFQKLKSQLSSLICFFVNVKFLLLLPLLMYSVIQFGFLTAEFTKAFVTCSLGIHMVGYTMICFGVCGGLSSYLSGLLIRFTGRIPLFILAGAINLVLLVFMKQWHPSPNSLVPFFIIMGLWGISDGIWISQVNSLMGIIFPQKYEEAYAGLRIAQGFGPAITFAYSSSLCMELKIFILIALCVVSLTLYLIMEGLLRRKQRQVIIKFKQTSV